LALDPIARAGRRRFTPFLWFEAVSKERLDDNQKTFLAESADHEVLGGASVPIRSRDEVALMSFVPFSHDDAAQRYLSEMLPDLHVLGLHYHLRHAQLTELPRQRDQIEPLSARERECLAWVAAGKTTWEVSQILHLSERTIHFHLENACNKLGATNRIQAVVMAISRGLIPVA